MPRQLHPLPAVLALSGALWLSGCVSSGTYELARKDAENATLLYQNEARRAQELTALAQQLTARIDAAKAELRSLEERIARTEQDFQRTRDELLEIKIDREREQHAIRKQLKVAQARLQQEQALIDADASVRPKLGTQSEETRKRLKELVGEIQGLLREMVPLGDGPLGPTSNGGRPGPGD